MIRLYIFALVILTMGFRAVAQDKLLVAGSGNPEILLVDKQSGKVEWKHSLEKGQECNSVALTKDGNVLYSYKQGAKLINWDHQAIWDYKTPDKTELQSATILRNGGVLLGICGNPAEFIELDKKGKVVNKATVDLGVERPHSQFRQIFQLKNKNYLVPVMAKQKVLEVNRTGKVVADYQIGVSAFSSLELADGNWLLPCGDNHSFMIIDRKTGKELKKVNANDIEGVSLLFVGQIIQLKNKNLLICNWNGHTRDASVDEPQLIEVNTDGKMVWNLHEKQSVGKLSAACYLYNFKLPNLK